MAAKVWLEKKASLAMEAEEDKMSEEEVVQGRNWKFHIDVTLIKHFFIGRKWRNKGSP